ncbi:fungal-specific transcription factor domain-containing protein [Poronia punctata]|nr:fungal-specific transcription factor domain-containing protein [Poronia punctata]
MAGVVIKEASEEMDIDILDQENVSQRASSARRGNKQNIRHRASIACFSCRDRRIRCVVPKGGSSCTQCKRSGTECVIKMDDERRRPISKVYVSSLSARIDMLEGMLREKGVVVPPATHPPMTKHEGYTPSSGDELRISTAIPEHISKSDLGSAAHYVLSPPDSGSEFGLFESPTEDSTNSNTLPLEVKALKRKRSSSRSVDLQQDDSMQRLFSPKGGLSVDHLSGRLRYFGPTANIHVYADSPDRYDSREPPEQVRRAERIIRSLTPKTHDHLMQNFWTYHNSVLQVIDRNAFEGDRGSERPRYYSSFLHIVILAIGWRLADKDRCDVARLNLGNRESTLHREARYMFDIELERPMGIPSVQALILLGDLECGVGRDNAGWMYAGMAIRLAFDIGLHTDCDHIALTEQEINIRQRVMKACILYDRYWALFLGRPTSIKSQDVGLDLSSRRGSYRSHPLSNSNPQTETQAREEEIHDQLLQLMELTSGIVETRTEAQSGSNASPTSEESDNRAYMRVLAIDQQLRGWYARLPDHLTWKVVNTRAAPFSYFLLHQQYNAMMIILHRSWEYDGWTTGGSASVPRPSSRGPLSTSNMVEKREDSVSGEATDSEDGKCRVQNENNLVPERSVCTKAAIQFAQVLSQSKQRYPVEKTGFTSLQAAGAATTALIAAIAYSKSETDRRSHLSYLGVVADAVQNMSRSYQPAARMVSLTQTMLSKLQLPRHDVQDGRLYPFEQAANALKDGSQGTDDDQIKLLPVRREHNDQDRFLGNRDKHTRTTSFQRDAMVAPTFSGSPSPSINKQAPLPSNTQQGSVPTLFSSLPDQPSELFNVNTPRTLAAGVDRAYGGPINRGVSDDYLRVAPSAEGWGLHSLHAAGSLSYPVPNFNSQLFNWTAGGPATMMHQPAMNTKNTGMDPPMLNRGAGRSDLIMSNEMLPICKTEDSGSLAWMSSENQFNGITPVGLADLGQACGKDEMNLNQTNSPILRRNHELDFLSF